MHRLCLSLSLPSLSLSLLRASRRSRVLPPTPLPLPPSHLRLLPPPLSLPFLPVSVANRTCDANVTRTRDLHARHGESIGLREQRGE